MDIGLWTDLLLGLSALYAVVIFLKLHFESQSYLFAYLSLSSVLLLFITGLPYTGLLSDSWVEWTILFLVITLISALLVLIRESKPAFARFPSYMTALPFISVLFFPFVIDSYAIKDLLNMIYQGGALVVALLVISINHFIKPWLKFFLTGTVLLGMSYLAYWFIFDFINGFSWLISLILTVSVILLTTGFKKVQEST